jgi:hypothetical protein
MAAATPAATDPVFVSMEVHRVARHRLDDACTKASVLFASLTERLSCDELQDFVFSI